VADHLADLEISDEQVARFYESNKERFRLPPAEDAAPDAEPQYQSLEEVKDSVAEQLKQVLARKAAADLADEMVAELADETMSFQKAAEKLGLEIVSNTPAFALTDSVKGIDPSAPFQRAAFDLEKDETHYYSDPVIGRDTVYVISLVKKLPSFLPGFEVVRDEVMELARISAVEKAYLQKAEQVHGEIAEALKAGTAFADAAGKYKLEVKKTEPFDISTTLEEEFGQQLKGAAVLCSEGSLTDLVAAQDQFLVAYVAEKIPGDEEAALPGMRAELVRNLTNEKSVRLVGAWQNALMEEAGFEDLLTAGEEES
jgi:hypothetical protein